MAISSVAPAYYLIALLSAVSFYFLFRAVQNHRHNQQWDARRARNSGVYSETEKAPNYLEKLQSDALAAGVQISFAGIVLIALAGMAGGFLIALLITGNPMLSLLGLAGGLLLPHLWKERAIEGRRKAFNLQLEEVLSKLSACLQANMNLRMSLNEAVRDADDPAREVFHLALNQIDIGHKPSDALREAGHYVRSRDMDSLATAVSVCEMTGGNLAEVLTILEESLRDQRNFRKQLKASTTEGTLTAWILAAMPFIFVGLLRVMMPALMDPLFNTLTGNIIFIVSCVMIVIGVRKIQSITTPAD